MLCATGPDEIPAVLEAAERALTEGHYVAGFLSYELGAGLAGRHREPEVPLALLGVFDAPASWVAPMADFAISPLLRTVDAATYSRTIAAIHDAIYDGNVYQVNYTVPFAFEIRGNIEAAFASVAASARAPYQAIIEFDDLQILSWSPELFLRFDGNTLETRPMKGTAPQNDEQALLSEKNRGEHIMIVDLLRNDLQRVCDDVRVESLCTVERYPTYSTLTSSIVGWLRNGATFADVIHATFPCGSVTGAPKRSAIEHIERYEARARGAYCGAIGYLSPERRGWWNVAIRTAQLRNGVGRFDAGGGIVIDSDAGDEWSEVITKSAFLRAHTSPVSLIETFAADAPPETVALHLARLANGAATLDLHYDADALTDAIAAQAASATILRLSVQADGSFTIRAEPLTVPEEPVRVCLSSERVYSANPWLAIKSSWREPHARASKEAAQRGCFDAILRNERGELTEGSRTTLFVERDGRLLTPALQSGLLPGVLRAQMIERGKARECILFEDDLGTADAIYVGNSARGLQRAELLR